MTVSTSIRIFLVDGTPDGLRIVEKSNWTGQAVMCSRAQYPNVRKRPEFDNPGVYCLLGPASDEGAEPKLYIGESDVLRDRLDQHFKTKEFWTRLVAFSSKDLNLNKAHIKHVESRLVGLALSAKTWIVENGNVPQLPNLSEPDTADAEWFLAEMLVIYPVLGVDAFAVPKREASAGEVLHLKGRGAEGSGQDAPDGFIIFEGALARDEEVDSIPRYASQLRGELLASGVLSREPAGLRVTQDYRFNSPSNAASVLLARPANGRVEWKNKAGRTLKELQEAAVE